MITLSNVCFGYPKKSPLFKDLSAELPPGRIYGLLGKNGEGKSSLLRNIAGLLFPDSGMIQVDGYEPRLRDAEFLQEVFFIPEEIYLPPISVNGLSHHYGGLYPRFDADRFFELISKLQIPVKNRLDKMSYGQKKKALIAFALAANTKLVLMDEPTNGLDIPSKSLFRKLVLSHLGFDRLFIISTHQVRDLDNLIDSVIILNDGEIVVQESLDNICQRIEFDTLAGIDIDERILYKQPFLGGFKVLRENVFGVESVLDIEQFFNAAIEYPDRIKQVFHD
ncbi:ABC transporter ATP-binding protein [Salmonirosea aquatica]|uniref:ATP-binding cassette domain-containing protein n=1 Tax=Salmonirosea aquatica TaxID=2654236 RepID=A0A7C9F488_9BACT|nr:ATP-binding cassette domain-containing protein [Cytophagaceae bacterium SJW1-29]